LPNLNPEVPSLATAVEDFNEDDLE
jgi:hypothetical protein